MGRLLKSFNTYYWPILVSLHGILLIGLYQKFGFNVCQEGGKYLKEAEYFVNGHSHKAFEYQIFYASYILYLAVFKFFKLPYLFIFISNYALSLIGYYCFYKLIKEMMGGVQSKLWLVMMLLSPLIQYWQFNLFSETFYIACSLMYAYVVFYPNVTQRFAKIIALSVILMFSRPSGIFTVSILLSIYAYSRGYLSKTTMVALGSLIVFLLFTGVVFLMPLHYHGFSKDIAMGAVYCGFPTLPYPVLPKGDYTLWQCYQFTAHHHGIGRLAELFFKKLNSFFVITRPYYTVSHNLMNALHYVCYPLAVYAVYATLRHKPRAYGLLMAFGLIICLSALMVCFIFNEWSERHTVLVFPFIFLLAAEGMVHLFKLLNHHLAV